jgi:chromosomal replication initiation ATPase DnaA
MSNRTETLLLALQHSIDKLGIEKTIENLKEAADERNKNVKDFIIYQVCDFYKIEMESLKDTIKGKSEKKISQVLSYLLYYQGFLTQEEIGNMVGRSKAAVNRYISDLLRYSQEDEKENDFKKELNMFEKKILKFKENIYG